MGVVARQAMRYRARQLPLAEVNLRGEISVLRLGVARDAWAAPIHVRLTFDQSNWKSTRSVKERVPIKKGERHEET